MVIPVYNINEDKIEETEFVSIYYYIHILYFLPLETKIK